jgi:hypothetical protein
LDFSVSEIFILSTNSERSGNMCEGVENVPVKPPILKLIIVQKQPNRGTVDKKSEIKYCFGGLLINNAGR